MYLESITLENVKSFRNQETVTFNDDINILVGPNAGGKSNLLDIITVVLNQYLLKQFEEDQISIGLRIRQTDQFGDVTERLEKYIGEEAADSMINLTLVVSPEDVANVQAIMDHTDELAKAIDEKYARSSGLDTALSFVNRWDPDALTPGDQICFKIVNANLEDPSGEALTYLEYLNHLKLFLLLADEIEEFELFPPYFYFSPYRGGIDASKQVELHTDDYSERFNEYYSSTSLEQTSAIELALFKLAQQKREIEGSARSNDSFYNEPEVQLIDDYLQRLGYDWSLECVDSNLNQYELFLEKDGTSYEMTQLSSGETEILNFLMGILAMNIVNGLIIIDEPELHLHPRWQIVLLDLVDDLIALTGNQFVFTTHSPTFIRRETIAKVLRVYQDDVDSTRVDRVTGFESDLIDDLVHVINSYNNEKMFFADDVVLVEGIKDQLIFQSLIDYYLDETDDPRIVEVLEVDGKHNFEKYTPLLDDLSIPHYIIADRDYAADIGDEDIADLFVTSKSRIEDRVLKDPDSRDHQALTKRMDDAIESGDPDDMERVREVWDHVGRRMTEFKSELTEDEQETWDTFGDQQAEEGIYILPHGELRAHDGPTDVQDAIEITKEENFDEWVAGGGERRTILKDVVSEIVGRS